MIHRDAFGFQEILAEQQQQQQCEIQMMLQWTYACLLLGYATYSCDDSDVGVSF
jgi:hypothetical protein